MLEVRIKDLCPQFHATGGDGMNLTSLWQRSTPNTPERMSTDHSFAIETDPCGPFGADSGMPVTSSFLVWKDLARRRSRPQHVQVMHFAEQILQVFEIVTPGQMQFGQKIFDRVAKILHADAQYVGILR